ncbi:MAG: type III-B CRISPR module-associated Cmr3 family protein [Thermoplasmata archaeon]
MNEKTILLTQIDSWFFRDGRPFNMNEFSQSDINSLFPPNPQTVVGAIRAALARANGWNGCGSWSSEIASWLGDGQNLGKLRFKGPYLMKDGACLFPAPLYFGRYKKEDELGKDVSRCNNCFGLAELGSEVECDLGMVRLPKFEKYKKNAECKGKEKNTKCKWKPFDKAYLTKENMELVLKGEISDGIKIVESKDLWSNEYRLGIELEKQKKTTKEEAL